MFLIFLMSFKSLQPHSHMMFTVLDLPDGILHHVLEFVKDDSYALIGPVNRQFNRCFKPCEKVTRTSTYTQNCELFKKAIYELKIPFHKDFVEHAIIRHDVAAIRLALSLGFDWDPFCVMTAAEVDCLEFFKWLVGQPHLRWLPENAFSIAAIEGNTRIMKFLVEMKTGYPDCRAMPNAMGYGRAETIEYLKTLEEDPCYKLVKAARQDNVTFFHTHFSGEHGDLYVREACSYGSLKVLEFLYDLFEILPTAVNVQHAVEIHREEVREWYDSKSA